MQRNAVGAVCVNTSLMSHLHPVCAYVVCVMCVCLHQQVGDAGRISVPDREEAEPAAAPAARKAAPPAAAPAAAAAAAAASAAASAAAAAAEEKRKAAVEEAKKKLQQEQVGRCGWWFSTQKPGDMCVDMYALWDGLLGVCPGHVLEHCCAGVLILAVVLGLEESLPRTLQ